MVVGVVVGDLGEDLDWLSGVGSSAGIRRGLCVRSPITCLTDSPSQFWKAVTEDVVAISVRQLYTGDCKATYAEALLDTNN